MVGVTSSIQALSSSHRMLWSGLGIPKCSFPKSIPTLNQYFSSQTEHKLSNTLLFLFELLDALPECLWCLPKPQPFWSFFIQAYQAWKVSFFSLRASFSDDDWRVMIIYHGFTRPFCIVICVWCSLFCLLIFVLVSILVTSVIDITQS